MTENKKAPREWAIHSYKLSGETAYIERVIGPKMLDEVVHVIEKSAYDALLKITQEQEKKYVELSRDRELMLERMRGYISENERLIKELEAWRNDSIQCDLDICRKESEALREENEKLREKNKTIISYVDDVLIPNNKPSTVRVKDPINTYYKECFDRHLDERKFLREKLGVARGALEYALKACRKIEFGSMFTPESELKIMEKVLKEELAKLGVEKDG